MFAHWWWWWYGAGADGCIAVTDTMSFDVHRRQAPACVGVGAACCFEVLAVYCVGKPIECSIATTSMQSYCRVVGLHDSAGDCPAVVRLKVTMYIDNFLNACNTVTRLTWRVSLSANSYCYTPASAMPQQKRCANAIRNTHRSLPAPLSRQELTPGTCLRS